MAIIKYTTSIDARKTISEIQAILVDHGASAVMVEYESREPVALNFKINTSQGEMGYRLPANPRALLQILKRDNVPKRFQTLDQATRVAWRIIKDWVAAQAALAETDMVCMEEIFLPYLLLGSDQTLFERWRDGSELLPGGETHDTTL